MLIVERAAFRAMQAHAEAEYGHECCGIMVGVRVGEQNRVERAFEADNVSPERKRDRFVMDPKAVLRADAWCREQGREMVGFYHSHPDHPPIASETDDDRAEPGIHDGYSFLILSVLDGRHDSSRSWTLSPSTGRLVEERLEIVESLESAATGG